MSDYKNTLTYVSNVIDSGCIITDTNTDWGAPISTDVYTTEPKYWTYTPARQGIITKGGEENMRYLYEVILVNPKNDTFLSVQIIARSETSALMKAYDRTDMFDNIEFDDLKTSCRVLMEWKKEKSLKKAIETIKEAVE